MHVAVAVGTLLLGAWVINPPADEEQSEMTEDVQPPAAAPSSGSSSTSQPTSPRQTRMDRQRSQMQRGAAGERQRAADGGRAGRTANQRSAGMPMVPTATSPAGGMFGYPTAPTAAMPEGPVSTVGQGAFGPTQPMAPTARDPSALRTSPDVSRRLPSSLSSGGTTPQPAKAFTDYRPTSGVSPYMNLFRIQGDTLDNYSSLVRPQVEQRFFNRQLGQDLRSLQNNARTQGVDLQQLYRANQTLQGVATPQYYQNTGNYYQGYGQ
jgi:hypothetical protein